MLCIGGIGGGEAAVPEESIDPWTASLFERGKIPDTPPPAIYCVD